MAKSIVVISATTQQIFENFASLTLIDSGATDGFQISHDGITWALVPTGIVLNFGPFDLQPIRKLYVKEASGKTLALTAILIQ